MTVYLEPYNPRWKDEFESLKSVFKSELKDFNVEILHVGSTAIPGLLAKPILDIDIVLKDKSSLKDLSEKLELLGYKGKGDQGVPGRFAFKQISEHTPKTGDALKWQQHHLYVCYADSLALKNHIFFRDILLMDKSLVKKYLELKVKLVAEEGMTREYYTLRKTEFITNVLSSLGLDEKSINAIRRTNL